MRGEHALTLSGTPNAARVLDNLERGVLVLSPDLTVLYANARWTRWLGKRMERGASFVSLLAENEELTEIELRATAADGRARSFLAGLKSVDGAPVRVVCGVHRADDTLIIEARADNVERSALTDVTRRLAEATDIAEVLRTLCEIATR